MISENRTVYAGAWNNKGSTHVQRIDSLWPHPNTYPTIATSQSHKADIFNSRHDFFPEKLKDSLIICSYHFHKKI